MKIALLGATGNTGLQLISQALARGHEVTAIVRSPEKLTSFHVNKNFKAVKCNILKPDELAQHLVGHDCVLSALGAPGIHVFKCKFYLESMQSLVEAMKKSGLKRLLCITAFFTKHYYPGVYKIILRPMIGRQLDNMYEMEEWMFKEASDIDYTIVRPPRLSDESLRDKPLLVKEDVYMFVDVEVATDLPRANVAKFMLDTLEKNEHIQKAVAIHHAK